MENLGEHEPQPDTKPSRSHLNIGLFSVLVIVVTFIVQGFFLSTPSKAPPTNIQQLQATPLKTTDVRNSSDCFIVRTDITMLRASLSRGDDTPEQISFLLDTARDDFTKAASSFTGSKAAWLEKMAELSGKVSLFILTGAPEDGPEALEELYADMNLVDQFCQ